MQPFSELMWSPTSSYFKVGTDLNLHDLEIVDVYQRIVGFEEQPSWADHSRVNGVLLQDQVVRKMGVSHKHDLGRVSLSKGLNVLREDVGLWLLHDLLREDVVDDEVRTAQQDVPVVMQHVLAAPPSDKVGAPLIRNLAGIAHRILLT